MRLNNHFSISIKGLWLVVSNELNQSQPLTPAAYQCAAAYRSCSCLSIYVLLISVAAFRTLTYIIIVWLNLKPWISFRPRIHVHFLCIKMAKVAVSISYIWELYFLQTEIALRGLITFRNRQKSRCWLTSG